MQDMELEFQQLDLRYESLRSRHAKRERDLLASLALDGQLLPIVVVHDEGMQRYVVVDGYKRVRAQRRLGHDCVRATAWSVSQSEALLLVDQLMRSGGANPFHDAWLLRELQTQFGLSLDELSRRFDKSISWVSRRLALIVELPEDIQSRIRAGEIGAHTAMKYLVPLARANADDCSKLAASIAGEQLSTRDVSALYAAYKDGDKERQQRVCTKPLLFLRAEQALMAKNISQSESTRRPSHSSSTSSLTHANASLSSSAEYSVSQQHVLNDLGALAGIARRLTRRLGEGTTKNFEDDQLHQVQIMLHQARRDTEACFSHFQQELFDARPKHTNGHSETA